MVMRKLSVSIITFRTRKLRFKQIHPFHECYDATSVFKYKAKHLMLPLNITEIKERDTVLVEANIGSFRIKTANTTKWWHEWKAFLELKSVSLIHRDTQVLEIVPAPSTAPENDNEIYI